MVRDGDESSVLVLFLLFFKMSEKLYGYLKEVVGPEKHFCAGKSVGNIGVSFKKSINIAIWF